MNVLLRCDGDSSTGMGHAVRCLALADELAGRGAEVAFATAPGTPGAERIASYGYPALDCGPGDPRGMLALHARLAGAEVVVVDLERGAPSDVLKAVRERTDAKVVSLNGTGYLPGAEGASLCDLVIAQGIPHWPVPDGWLAGPDYVVLRPAFRALRGLTGRDNGPSCGPSWAQGPPRVLVCGGGADLDGFSVRAAEALAGFGCALGMVVGPAAPAATEAAVESWAPEAEVQRDPGDLPVRMALADLAVASFGMTAFELACLGTPAVLLALTEDHLRSARLLEKRGCAVALGLIRNVSVARLRGAVVDLLGDPARRAAMGRAGSELVDGLGAQRVAEAIVALAS